MTPQHNRRDFLRTVGLTGAAAVALQTAPAAAASPTTKPAARGPLPKSDKPLSLALIGSGDRGSAVGSGFAKLPGAIINAVCDVDATRAEAAAKGFAVHQNHEPKTVGDLRQVIADPSIDAVIVATPDHWHAPAAILAIVGGKHVYVEKPCCHNPHEGELLVAAARKHSRIVQHGSQRRSYPKVKEAIERLQRGEFGKVILSRGWYNNNRGITGKRTPAEPPKNLNWDLWQGPAPRQPFTENVIHYKWHWYWPWGTGELGNNGIHSLDICRWGLGVDHPRRVTAGGGRYHFQDDQETPDTLSVTYDFGDKAIIWEGRSCSRHGFEGSGFGIAFYGDKSTLVIDGGGYRVLDFKDKPLETVPGPASDAPHFQNFLDCIATGAKPAAEIEEGYKSVLLCHLGNIAYRVGGAVECDPKTGRVLNNPPAEALWKRDYEKGWEPTI